MMKWGTFLITAAPPGCSHYEAVQNSIAYAQATEELGLDDIWVLEHHFTNYGLCGSPLAMAAFVLGQTKRVKVGTAVSVVPLEHPLRLAEEVALLDNMSGGRFMFGIGRGLFVKDFKIFGVDMEYNREKLMECVDVCFKAWKGPLSYDGKFCKFPEINVCPTVFTKPHPPVYAAVNSSSSVEWAARNGIPLLLAHFQDDATRAASVELYSEVASECGFDPNSFDHGISCIAGVGRTDDAVRGPSRERAVWWQEEFFRATELLAPENIKMRGYEWYARQWEKEVITGRYPVEERIERDFQLNPVGSVQHCVDVLSKTAEVTGVKHFICGFEAVSAKKGPVLESMQMFKEEVIPKVQVPRKRW